MNDDSDVVRKGSEGSERSEKKSEWKKEQCLKERALKKRERRKRKRNKKG